MFKKDKYVISAFKNGRLVERQICFFSKVDYNFAILKIRKNNKVLQIQYLPEDVTKIICQNNSLILLKKC